MNPAGACITFHGVYRAHAPLQALRSAAAAGEAPDEAPGQQRPSAGVLTELRRLKEGLNHRFTH
jgi:hypothetical protein